MAASHAKLASLQEIRLAELLGALSHALDMVEGQPAKTVKAGEVFFVPAGVVHDGRNVGSGKAVVLATYIVETGKPVATAAK